MRVKVWPIVCSTEVGLSLKEPSERMTRVKMKSWLGICPAIHVGIVVIAMRS